MSNVLLPLKCSCRGDTRSFRSNISFNRQPPPAPYIVEVALGRHVARGLLADDGERVRLTWEGLFVSDAIWPDFLRR